MRYINGQIERFHSILFKAEQTPRSFEELLERATNEYNCTFRSTTGKKPLELFLGRSPRITQKQRKDIEYHNKKPNPIKTYNPGDVIFVRHNKRLGSKLTFQYRKEVVKENKNTVVITESGKTVHKSHIRN